MANGDDVDVDVDAHPSHKFVCRQVLFTICSSFRERMVES